MHRLYHQAAADRGSERLADAAAHARQGARWEGPGLRMRCTTTETVYEWPEGAPYEGGTTVTPDGYGRGVVSRWLSEPDDVQHRQRAQRPVNPVGK